MISPKRNKTYEDLYGKEKSIEIRRKIRKYVLNNNYWRGRHHSEETKRKISKAQIGEKNHNYGKSMDDEQRRRISEFNKGYKHSMEVKKKISKSKIGKKRSEETRMKISATKQGVPLKEWMGCISDNSYDCNFTLKFKEAIKERDNYTCLLCNIFEDDCKSLYKQKLSIHHVDYDKKNTFPQNCCLLCLRCNNLVNKDREIWTKHFHELLRKLYGYEYTPDQKIVLDFMEENNG